MMSSNDAYMLFAGTSHPELGKQIAKCLDISLGNISIETFPDGEIGVQILENVHGRDVFVLQTIARHPNLYLMELLITVDALKRAGAHLITAVVPYFGYGRQDRKGVANVPITAKLVADLLEKAGVARILTMDLHSEQIQGFFDIPVYNLFARSLLVESLKKWPLQNSVVVSPDVGRIKLARAFAEELGTKYAVVDKRRVDAKQVESDALIGDVDNKDVILVDDICSTGETLGKALRICKAAGAKKIFAVVTHGLFVREAFKESAIEKMLITNTVDLQSEDDVVETVSVAPLFAQAIRETSRTLFPC
jgi:ribose-phosphate pyrophosphokinase